MGGQPTRSPSPGDVLNQEGARTPPTPPPGGIRLAAKRQVPRKRATASSWCGNRLPTCLRPALGARHSAEQAVRTLEHLRMAAAAINTDRRTEGSTSNRVNARAEGARGIRAVWIAPGSARLSAHQLARSG